MGMFDTDKGFQAGMRPAAVRIYGSLWPGCRVEDLRADGVKVHVLDKEFGIDTIATVASGQWFTIQEKYRRHENLAYGDFTQEFENAVGTEFQSPGEWFTLGAQLYFYGWADRTGTDFAKWFVMDVPRYKLLVERIGGLGAIGTRRQNRTHGRSSFYTIPLDHIASAILYRGPACAWVPDVRAATGETTVRGRT